MRSETLLFENEHETQTRKSIQGNHPSCVAMAEAFIFSKPPLKQRVCSQTYTDWNDGSGTTIHAYTQKTHLAEQPSDFNYVLDFGGRTMQLSTLYVHEDSATKATVLQLVNRTKYPKMRSWGPSENIPFPFTTKK